MSGGGGTTMTTLIPGLRGQIVGGEFAMNVLYKTE